MEDFQPPSFRRSLFPHQLKNIATMEEFEKKQRVEIDARSYIKSKLGFLADKTGYGKTASVIGLLIRDRMDWDLTSKHEVKSLAHFSRNYLMRIKKKTLCARVNCNLILVPDAIAFQWEEELSYSDLRVLVVNQSQRLKRSIEGVDVVVVTPRLFNQFLMRYKNVAWKRFIFDEPGNIKVPGMNDVVAGFYWFVTATVGRVFKTHQNCTTSFMYGFLFGSRVGETGRACNSEFDWLKFNRLTIKNDDETLALSFNSPPIHHREYFTVNHTFTIVKNYATEVITQMVSAGNISGALEALGGKRSDNLFELLKLTKENKIELLKQKIEGCAPDKQKTVKKCTAEIQKLGRQIQEIQSQYESLIGTDCLICYEPLKNPVMEPVCETLFCGACFLKWLKEHSTCPHCRSEIDTGNIYYVETERASAPTYKDKMDILFEILENKPEGSFIIFASYDQSFKNIVSALQIKKLPFIQAKGPSKNVENNLKRFKAGEVNILLLNSNHNGAGINLQEATDVILYHKMDSNTEIQVVGRANRIGRTEPLTVHHLLYK